MFFFDMRTKLSIIKIIFFSLFIFVLFCFNNFYLFLILKLWIFIFITKFLFKRQIWTNWLSFFINSQFNFNSNFFSPLLHVSIHSSINYLHPHTSSSIMSASFPCIACIINQFKTSHVFFNLHFLTTLFVCTQIMHSAVKLHKLSCLFVSNNFACHRISFTCFILWSTTLHIVIAFIIVHQHSSTFFSFHIKSTQLFTTSCSFYQSLV